jgi:hypothetical protein
LKKHILVINQHGENRSDEVAMQTMLEEFQSSLKNVEFTLLFQFRDRDLRLEYDQEVEDLPMILPLLDYARLLIFTLFKV